MRKSFAADRSGAIAIMMALTLVPLILAIGFAVDYGRYLRAQTHLQELADAASLAAASSGEKDPKKLRLIADDFVEANHGESFVDNITVSSFTTENNEVDISLGGQIQTYFMGLASIPKLNVGVESLALRAVTGSVEVALVLDNTWSMSAKDGKGVTKISALKQAAESLVEELMANKDANVRIGLVPYADYVNVGTQHRQASWLSVPADYDVAYVAPICEIKRVTEEQCVKYAPKTCTKTTDGVKKSYACNGDCTKTEMKTYDKKVNCKGGQNAASYKWYGCVGSRMTGTTRLNDGSPTVKYPGYVETSQKCLNPIVALTADETKLTTAINNMIINIGGYEPLTYIPAGLIWGQNILSQAAPFTDGEPYDPDNKTPRKVVVLMTDGDNSMIFSKSNGRHNAKEYPEDFDTSDPKMVAARAAAMKPTNDDTAAICTYMKARNIEIYTVAFMVNMSFAKNLLEGCASDSEHYYDASDPEALVAAFSDIAQSLSQVRLAR